MSSAFEQVLGTMSTADRLLLLWVQARCRSHEIEQPFSPEFMDNVRLLCSVWGDFAKQYPHDADVAYIQTVIKSLKDNLVTTGEDGNIEMRRLKQVSRLAILNERYASCRENQRQVDKKRIANGEPILLPLHFPFHEALSSPALKKKLAQLDLPPPEEPSPPFTIDDKQYRYVERRRFADRYGAVYRVPYDTTADVVTKQTLIDMNRIERDLPILLPYGFRFWAEGFGWDGFEATPGGKALVEYNLPYTDDSPGWYQIDKDIGVWGSPCGGGGVVNSNGWWVQPNIEIDIPSDRFKKGPIFEYEGRKHQYVDVADYIEAYHMPARVDMTDPWRRICIPFFDAVKQAVEFFINADPAHNDFIALLAQCHLDDDVAVSLAHSRVPHELQEAVDGLDGFGTDGGQIKRVFESWVHQQMLAWVEKYNDSGKGMVDLDAILFTKIYRILSRSLLLHTEVGQATFIENSEDKTGLDHTEQGYLESPTLSPPPCHIPEEYRSEPMSMKLAAIGCRMSVKKLNGILTLHPECRYQVYGQSFIFDTRFPPFDKLKEYYPEPTKRNRSKSDPKKS